MSSKPYYAHLDLLKGVAIVLVICGHIFVFGNNHQGGHENIVLWRVLESVHMPLFMMLSGYLATSIRPINLVDFVKTKATRLLLPLVFLPSLYFICFDQNIKLILSQTKKGGYWFTFVLFGIMIIFYLLKWFNSKINKRKLLYIEVGLGACSILIVLLLDGVLHGIKDAFFERILSFNQVNWLYKYFMLGYFVHRIPKLEATLRHDYILSTLVFSFIILMALPYQGVTWGNDWSFYHGLIGIDLEALQTLSGVLALYSFGLCVYNLGIDNRGTRLLIHLGRESLPIYLTHYFFLPVLPMMTPFLLQLPSKAAAFSWELLFAFLGAMWVLLLTLGTIRLVKLSPTLTMLLYGEKRRNLPKEHT